MGRVGWPDFSEPPKKNSEPPSLNSEPPKIFSEPRSLFSDAPCFKNLSSSLTVSTSALFLSRILTYRFSSGTKYWQHSSRIQEICVNLYKEYSYLKLSDLEELPCFWVMIWQLSQLLRSALLYVLVTLKLQKIIRFLILSQDYQTKFCTFVTFK